MAIYEKNLLALQEARQDFYNKLSDRLNGNIDLYKKIYTGNALDGDKFLVIMDGDVLIPLASTYSPCHEAERYALQYEENWELQTLLLFGFGNPMVIRQILSDACPINRCIVYEPSIDILKKVLEEYEIEDLLRDSRLTIMVKGINGEELEEELYSILNYETWRYFYFSSLTSYEKLFENEYKEVQVIAKRVAGNKSAELNSLSHFAKAGMENEIKAFYWMMKGKILSSMHHIFPEDLPCIVVAAGPSLEKNVDVLKQAKGKAFILCVDTALTFLLERGIVPDMACTVDPQKGPSYFIRPELSEIPIAVSTDSDYRALETIKDIKPVYFSTTNDFCERLYKEQGYDIEYFDGGGSVGTVCFQIGLNLGFKTIIIIGQDLAFTEKKSHAGTGDLKEEDMIYGMLMVDGYYGDRVLTRLDFKHYIDWYNMKIPQLTDVKVINATEGGARLTGAEQMTLQEAVDKYCVDKYDIEKLLEEVPEVWDSWKDKQKYYKELKDKYQYFVGMKRRLIEGIEGAKRGIVLLSRSGYQKKELQKIDKELNDLVREISSGEGILILIKRTIDSFVTMNDDLLNGEKRAEQEGIRLYKKMQNYLQELLDAMNELLPIWKEVINKINEEYGFE